ncbi:hypothetical protein [Photobacterium phosphoreum]|uniref:hypothetical protein n=1 Tax=Photobacterium phosphoreum TaxID=659 RepID=UPI001E4D8BF7|nr:hypothetical protein [Photobacterium phosphoreum]MCD9505511.1 hypothetical protein [Photobacterium phosphoreum]
MKTHSCNATNMSLRNPAVVMQPKKLGAMHQNRLSFVRILIRRMANQQWKITPTVWNISSQGYGIAQYRLDTPNQHYHLVVFSNAINDEDRNDRVIAEKWDVTFALVVGDVDDVLFDQLHNNVPLQEAGRLSSQVLVLARANKSVRIFNHIIEKLAQGQQPETQLLADVGYILRTTAVYGNGKFGIADFELLEDNPDLSLSFSAQMCAVYILRQFSLDWVHFLAQQQANGNAATLARPLQRYIGIGNATGLGMAPYLIRHPRIIDQWMTTRETAIAMAMANPITSAGRLQLVPLLQRAIDHLQQTTTIDVDQRQLNVAATIELQVIIEQLTFTAVDNNNWQDLLAQYHTMSQETQEILTSCILELYPEQIDMLENNFNADETLSLSTGICVSDLISLLQQRYQWALDIDFYQPLNNYWFWYRSKDKEEPRIGIRGQEAGEEKELALDIARQVFFLYQELQRSSPQETLATFLLKQPQYRAIARRTWTLGQCAMGDIQINILDQSTQPIHLLRCKLAMFGATKFDPRSDRWLRVTFFQGAPLSDELHPDEWLFPLLPTTTKDIKELP